MSEKSFIKFQIRYLKSYLKHVAFVGRENKIIFNVQSRLNREYNALYKSVDMKTAKEERERVSKLMSAIEREIQSLQKGFDIDYRFQWRASLYEKFPLYIRYKNHRGEDRIHHMTKDEQVTAAHILYNRLRNKKSHLKDEGKEHEYTHSLTYWTERLAYLFQEECARRLSPRDFISPRNGDGECGDGIAGSDSHREGERSHE